MLLSFSLKTFKTEDSKAGRADSSMVEFAIPIFDAERSSIGLEMFSKPWIQQTDQIFCPNPFKSSILSPTASPGNESDNSVKWWGSATWPPLQCRCGHSDPSMPIAHFTGIEQQSLWRERCQEQGGDGWQGSPDATSWFLPGLVLMPKGVLWFSSWGLQGYTSSFFFLWLQCLLGLGCMWLGSGDWLCVESSLVLLEECFCYDQCILWANLY